ncbi:MAG: hypothetical protein WCQ80_03285 [Bacilli bacterium]
MLMFKVLQLFQIADDVIEIERFGRGFINRTYYAKGEKNYYILQMMDSPLFENPENTIDNIVQVCHFLGKKYFNPDQYIDLYTQDGQRFVKLQNTIWHGFSFPKTLKLFKRIPDETMMFSIGKAVGLFHRIMIDFPVNQLHPVFPMLHDFQNEYERMMIASSNDPFRRDMSAFNETKFITDHHDAFFTIDRLIEKKEIPIRVAHNNIRMNNLLFEEETYQKATLIGYDVVGANTILYDLGETIRHLISTTREDDIHLEAVKINLDHFRAFIQGYFQEMDNLLTPIEEENIVEAARIVTLEEAMRYNTDYLENDITFKVDYRNHNYDRCKNQIELVKYIEKNHAIMNDIVRSAKQKAYEK